MKKILPLILLVSLLLSVHVAVAEADFDFTSYSYEQLIGIKEQLDAEITTRPEAGERILQPGQYVVGKDIAQGVYDVGFVAAEEDDTYTNWYIYDTKQMYDYDVSRLFLGDLPRNEGRVQEGSSVKVELFDGDYFVIYRSAASSSELSNSLWNRIRPLLASIRTEGHVFSFNMVIILICRAWFIFRCLCILYAKDGVAVEDTDLS